MKEVRRGRRQGLLATVMTSAEWTRKQCKVLRSALVIWLPWWLRRYKHLPTMRETQVRSLGQKDPLEKEYWRILQYSYLENPMDRGARSATVQGVAKSQTRLSDFTSLLWLFSIFNTSLQGKKDYREARKKASRTSAIKWEKDDVVSDQSGNKW